MVEWDGPRRVDGIMHDYMVGGPRGMGQSQRILPATARAHAPTDTLSLIVLPATSIGTALTDMPNIRVRPSPPRLSDAPPGPPLVDHGRVVTAVIHSEGAEGSRRLRLTADIRGTSAARTERGALRPTDIPSLARQRRAEARTSSP
jgi:hypothetical protein